MSHTFSLSVYAPLQADLFSANVLKPLRSAQTFSDWDAVSNPQFTGSASVADELIPESGQIYVRALRSAGRRTRGWHFEQSPKTRYLSICLPIWTNDPTRLMLGLNILRQILPTSGDGQPGYILAHRFDAEKGETLCAILLRHGTSRVASASEPVVKELIAHASPLALRVEAKSKLPTPHIVDELDALIEARELA